MNEDQKGLAESQKIEHYEDEIELMDYLLVIWKWKYVIVAGTLAFGFIVALISFIAIKQQPTMYRTSLILKPGLLKIDKTGKKIFIDSPKNIKALIENDLKYKVLEQFKNSNNLKLSTALNFQVDIQKGSDIINVSLESASADDSTAKLNYLIKAIVLELNYIKNNIDNSILLKKDEFYELSFKKERIKAKIKKYEKELSDIEANIKLLKDSKDILQNKEYMLSKLSLENDYRNTFGMYFMENENAKLDLFEIQKKTNKLSKEIEKYEKKKQDFKIIQIIQPPITTELPKGNKISYNLILSLVAGLLSMLVLSLFLEYLSNYKKRVSNK